MVNAYQINANDTDVKITRMYLVVYTILECVLRHSNEVSEENGSTQTNSLLKRMKKERDSK